MLIFAPHPDDEALGCGGTITLLNKSGMSSTVVFVTDGEKLLGNPSSDIAKKRRSEAQRACDMLGCGAIFLGSPDGETAEHKEEVYDKLYEIIERKKPDIVFSPSPCDFHSDHIAAALITMDLLKNTGSFKLAYYEIYSTVRFTHLIDISGVAENKKRVILNYRTSLFERPELYVSASLGLNAQRSIFTEKNGYYEAFWVIEKPMTGQEIMEWLTYRKR